MFKCYWTTAPVGPSSASNTVHVATAYKVGSLKHNGRRAVPGTAQIYCERRMTPTMREVVARMLESCGARATPTFSQLQQHWRMVSMVRTDPGLFVSPITLRSGRYSHRVNRQASPNTFAARKQQKRAHPTDNPWCGFNTTFEQRMEQARARTRMRFL